MDRPPVEAKKRSQARLPGFCFRCRRSVAVGYGRCNVGPRGAARLSSCAEWSALARPLASAWLVHRSRSPADGRRDTPPSAISAWAAPDLTACRGPAHQAGDTRRPALAR